MPIVYTPVVGEACQKFSHIYQHHRGPVPLLPGRRPHGGDAPQRSPTTRSPSSSSPTASASSASGDQGADGLGIPIGKLSLYSACGGIDPATTLPIVLDVGTNNEERRNDPDYLGWRHERVVGPGLRRASSRRSSQAVMKVFPDVHAPVGGLRRAPRPPPARPLPRPALHVQRRHPGHGHRRPGRRAVGAAPVQPVELVDQKIVIVGAGSAGTGIAEQIVAGHGGRRAVRGRGAGRASTWSTGSACSPTTWTTCESFQAPLAQSRDAVAGWTGADPATISLLDVMTNAKPSVLIGVTGVFGLFTEEVIRAMAAGNDGADHLPALEPHVAGRGHRRGRAHLDRRHGAGRHRAARSRPSTLNGVTYTDRPEQQLLHLPRHRPRRAGVEGHPGLRGDVHGGRPRAGRRTWTPRSRATASSRRSPRSAR